MSLIQDYDIETYKGVGIYFDDPKNVDKSKLRSEIGCIIEDKDSFRLQQIDKGLNTKIFPEKSYIGAEFPNKGKLSIIFGIMKVYPAIAKFVEKNNYRNESAVMEIYDVTNMKIVYRKEINE